MGRRGGPGRGWGKESMTKAQDGGWAKERNRGENGRDPGTTLG